jgi:hypothetical protein
MMVSPQSESRAKSVNAMIAAPGFNGSRFGRSWLPPSGKMPTQPLDKSSWKTASNILLWSVCGATLKFDPVIFPSVVGESCSATDDGNGFFSRSSVGPMILAMVCVAEAPCPFWVM